MHFEQSLQLQFVGFLGEGLALFLCQVGSDEQHGIGISGFGLIELIFIYDEVFAQDGAGDCRSGDADEAQGAAKVFFIGENGDGAGTVLTVGGWNHIGFPFFLHPAFRGAFALELRNDA